MQPKVIYLDNTNDDVMRLDEIGKFKVKLAPMAELATKGVIPVVPDKFKNLVDLKDDILDLWENEDDDVDIAIVERKLKENYRNIEKIVELNY